MGRPGRRRPGGDPRALSVTINYTLALVITAVLISGLFLGMNTLLENERREALDSELSVLGNRITADIAAADRLARVAEGSNSRVEVHTEVPRRVAGLQYSLTILSDGVNVDGDADPEYYAVTVYLDARGLGVNRSVSVRTVTEVAYTTLPGGDYVIVFDGTAMEVRND